MHQNKLTNTKINIFIHTNNQQSIGAKVALNQINKNLLVKSYDLKFIKLDDCPALKKFEGRSYISNGVIKKWTCYDLQSFTLLRFLPPQLCNFDGLSCCAAVLNE